MGKTVNEQVMKGNTLVSGLRSNIDEISAKGITIEMIDQLEVLCRRTECEGAEQDKIKEMYHSKTAELSALMTELKNNINEIKRLIKPYYAQNEWIKFGIEDKK